MSYITKVLSYSPIAYWPLNEASGTNANCLVDANQDGTYTGVTLGQTGIGDGETCPLFDGTNDFVDIYSTTFRDAFDGASGTAIAWVKVLDSSEWADNYQYPLVLRADAENRIRLLARESINDTLGDNYEAGNTATRRTIDTGGELGWMCVAITWNASGDVKQTFYNGSQVGGNQGSLGIWVGDLASNTTVIGAVSTSPSSLWTGWIAHVQVYDSVLSGADIADLASVSAEYEQSAAGALTAVGVITKQTSKSFVGSSTGSGALVKQITKAFTGSVTASGILGTVKAALKAVGGALTPAGILSRKTNKVLTGATTAIGILVKQAQKAVLGSITMAGVLGTVKTVLKTISGSLTPSGVLTRQTNKILTGSVTMLGSITRRISKSFTGAITMVGVLVRQLAGLPTPAKRIFAIESESRIYSVESESRIHSIQ